MILKSLFKFLYIIFPFAVGATIVTVLQISYPELLKKLDPFQVVILIFGLNLIVFIILKFIQGILFGKRNDLVTKMSKCSLRKQHGLNYCVECPESYTCPNELSGKG